MGMFLNSSVPHEGYKEVLRDTYFVDKTLILKELVAAVSRDPVALGRRSWQIWWARFLGNRTRRSGYLRIWQYPESRNTERI